MRRITLIVILIIGFGRMSYAQYVSDAVRFTSTLSGGTPRALGIGGAQTALGADLSNIAGNPAGLGFYRGADFNASLQYQYATNNSIFQNSRSTKSDGNLNINNLGVVFNQMYRDYNGKEKTSGIVGLSFGFGFTRNNNFNRSLLISGVNPNSSFAEYFSESANNYGYAYDIDSIAQYAGIIYFDGAQNRYRPITNGNQRQTEKEQINGNQNDFSMAIGANLSNVFYFGGSIQFSSLTYEKIATYSESEINDTVYGMNSFFYEETDYMTGSGVSAKIGIVVRPADFVRFGFTAQTSTYHSIEETYEFRLGSQSDSLGSYVQKPYYINLFEYNVTSPAKLSSGLAIVLGKNGFITADADFVNYQAINIGTDLNYSFDNDNNFIANNLRNVVNYRFGAEYRYAMLSFRGGYAYYADPYNLKDGIDRSRTMLSGGIGIRLSEDYYLDIVGVHSSTERLLSLYSLDNKPSPTATLEDKSLAVSVSFGARF